MCLRLLEIFTKFLTDLYGALVADETRRGVLVNWPNYKRMVALRNPVFESLVFCLAMKLEPRLLLKVCLQEH